MTWTLVAQLSVLALVVGAVISVLVSMVCDAARDIGAMFAPREPISELADRMRRR